MVARLHLPILSNAIRIGDNLGVFNSNEEDVSTLNIDFAFPTDPVIGAAVENNVIACLFLLAIVQL